MSQPSFLEQINTKQEKAWESLYQYYYAPLCRYAEKLLGEEDGAEDIVQECLIRMWNSSVDFKEKRALVAWLYKSVYRSVITFLRDKRTQDRHEQEWSEEGCEEEEAQKIALKEEAISRFYEVLERMPQQQREILKYCLKGLKTHEIAELLNISENTVKTQKKRAYLFVRTYYDSKLLQLLFFWAKFQ